MSSVDEKKNDLQDYENGTFMRLSQLNETFLQKLQALAFLIKRAKVFKSAGKARSAHARAEAGRQER